MATAIEAWAWCRHEAIDLVLIDVSLRPTDSYSNGCALGTALAREWPRVRVLFVSGHGEEHLRLFCPPGIPLLQKPFGPAELRERVRQVLGAPPWIP